MTGKLPPELMARLDDETIPESTWLQLLVKYREHLESANPATVIADIKNRRKGENLRQRMIMGMAYAALRDKGLLKNDHDCVRFGSDYKAVMQDIQLAFAPRLYPPYKWEKPQSVRSVIIMVQYKRKADGSVDYSNGVPEHLFREMTGQGNDRARSIGNKTQAEIENEISQKKEAEYLDRQRKHGPPLMKALVKGNKVIMGDCEKLIDNIPDNLFCLSWKWKERFPVKITERAHEKDAESLLSRGEGSHSEAAFAGSRADLEAVR